MRKYKYNYMLVSVPNDLFPQKQARGEYAIDEARERMRTWAVPCEWEAVRVNDGSFEEIWRVRRRAYKGENGKATE